MEIIKLAIRNLARQKKRTFLLGGAIAFGLMIVTIINGFVGAFKNNISENFANLEGGHVFVQGVEKSPNGKEFEIIRDDSALMAATKEANIPAKFVTKLSSFNGTMIYAGKTTQLGVVGVDFKEASYLPERLVFKSGGMKGMSDPQGLVLSEPVAKRLGVEVGDRVLAQMKTFSGQQNVGEFVIAGITADPGILNSMAGYANKPYVNELLNIAPGEYQSFCLYLPSLKGMDQYGTALYDSLRKKAQVFTRGEQGQEKNFIKAMMSQSKKETWTGTKYRVFTLNDMLQQIQQIVDVLNSVSLGILLVLFLIIMVGILNTFRIIIYERIREIGTMRSMGMQRSEVRGLFLWEATFLTLGGVLAGVLLALLIMGGVSLWNFGLNSPLFIILKNGHMTFRLQFDKTLVDILIVAALTLAAAYIPARSAARLDPAVALRSVK